MTHSSPRNPAMNTRARTALPTERLFRPPRPFTPLRSSPVSMLPEWLSGIVVSHPIARSGPGEHADGIFEHLPDVTEHGRAQFPVHDPVIKGQGQRGHLAHGDLAVVHPRRVPDPAE